MRTLSSYSVRPLDLSATAMPITALIIDDDELFADTVAFVLEQEDYTVFKARSGVEGLEIAREHVPDIVFCDVHMRNGHGYAVAQALRERPEMVRAPIIMMTGNASPFGESRSRSSGADRYLSKPFSVSDLLAVVKDAMEEKRSAARLRSSDVIFPTYPPRG